MLPALLFSAQAAGQLFSLAPEITRAKTAAQSVFSLHDEKPSIITESITPSNGVLVNDDSLLAGSSASYGTFGVQGELEFRNVSLYYESRPTVPAISNVSFLIRHGEYVAFVGRSVSSHFPREDRAYADIICSIYRALGNRVLST